MFKDLYLKFADEAEASSVLTVDSMPKYRNVDTIGVIYITVGETQEPLPGYHVNVRLVEGEDGSTLEPYSVQPTNPRRVWL